MRALWLVCGFASVAAADASAPAPAPFVAARRGMLVADGWLVISTQPDPRWEVVEPERSYREALHGILREERLPPAIRALRGTTFRLFDAHGYRCSGVVDEFRLETIGRDLDGSESGGLGYVDEEAARGRRVLVASLKGAHGCAEAAFFARADSLPRITVEESRAADAELRARFGAGWEVTRVRELISVARRRIENGHYRDYQDAWRVYRLDGARLVRLRAPETFYPGKLMRAGDDLFYDDGEDGRGRLRVQGDTVTRVDEVPVYRWHGMP